MSAVSLAEQFEREGYAVARGVFSAEEVEALLAHLMAMREEPCRGDDPPLDRESSEPLQRFPRIMHPHQWDERSRAMMLDERLGTMLTEMLGETPYAVQTMVYFKPAGARGQALHQDQFYLNVSPGTCVAAWVALDRCDRENGCMAVVPGSQNLPVLCPVAADTEQSFTDITVPVPEGMEEVPIEMEPGDVLFFNGSVIHGSGPNLSADRFRRSFIAHYATADVVTIGRYYSAAWTFAGDAVRLGEGEGLATCGEYVAVGGRTELRERPYGASAPTKAH